MVDTFFNLIELTLSEFIHSSVLISLGSQIYKFQCGSFTSIKWYDYLLHNLNRCDTNHAWMGMNTHTHTNFGS